VYFDLEDSHPEAPTIEGAMTRREAIIISIAAHIILGNLIIWLPTMPWFQRLTAPSVVPQPVQVVQQPQERMQPFILVEPKIDREALRAIERAPLSDKDRQAQTRERPPDPRNRQPFSRGTTPDFTEAERQAQRPRGQGPAPQPSIAQQGTNGVQREAPAAPAQPTPGLMPSDQIATRQPTPQPPQQPSGTPGPTTPPGGALGEALQNLNRYVQNQQFENPSGKGEFGPWIQFDTKGVEFGPWIRRFVAQVKRNWFVPYAAMSLRGHVVLTFNVHKDGRITDLQIIQPSNVDAFNNAAFNALTSSNPTMPLPPEYPSDKAFFTVTFFYNESPPPQ
jgi:TonB family protein